LKLRALSLAASLLPFALAACEDVGVCDEVPAGFATSPDEAVAFYRRAYMQRNAGALDQLLSSDFRRRMVATDADSLGLAREWSRAVELVNSQRMCSGLVGTRVDSLAQCPLDPSFFIGFSPFDAGGWQELRSGAQAGLLRREFDSLGQTNVGLFGLDFIRGRHLIYVRRETIATGECCCATVYRIAYWDDLGVASAGKHGFYSWSRILARWRVGAPPPKDTCE
jgi:hypothetical protein